jgi:hypothetical protein
LRVFRHPRRQGYGAALRTALDAARLPLLCTATCDRQYDPADLGKLLGPMDKVHVVTGYRLLLPVPWWFRLLHALYRGLLRVVCAAAPPPPVTWLGRRSLGQLLAARWVFGVHVHDPACAFRLCRRDLFRRIPVQCDGAFAQVEVLAKANFVGTSPEPTWLAEEPVSWTPPARPEEAVDQFPGEGVAAEAYRLFKDPDFGPPELPAPVPAPIPDKAPTPEPATAPKPGPPAPPAATPGG